MERETAWLVVPHLVPGPCQAAAESYLAQAVQAQPAFLPALLFKVGRGNTVVRNTSAMAAAFALLKDKDADVSSAAQKWLRAAPSATAQPTAAVTLRQPPVPEAVRTLVEAVDQNHAESDALKRFFQASTDRETVVALAQAWADRHQP